MKAQRRAFRAALLLLGLMGWGFITLHNQGCNTTPTPTPTPTPKISPCSDIGIEGEWARIMEDGSTRVIIVSAPKGCVVEVTFGLVHKGSITPEMAIYTSTILKITKHTDKTDYLLLHHDESLPSDIRSVTFTISEGTLIHDTYVFERVE